MLYAYICPRGCRYAPGFVGGPARTTQTCRCGTRLAERAVPVTVRVEACGECDQLVVQDDDGVFRCKCGVDW